MFLCFKIKYITFTKTNFDFDRNMMQKCSQHDLLSVIRSCTAYCTIRENDYLG